MKIVAMITILALVGVANRAQSGQDTNLSATVYVRASIGDPRITAMCAGAQSIASGMFATAGVHIHWRAGQPKTQEREQPILIDITSNTPTTLHPGALAYAQVFEGVHIRIFYDRLENASCPRATTMLLAHVLVHEITHLLEGVDRHSKAGVMKAHWTDKDLFQMAYKSLPFDPDDLRLIRRGLAIRSGAARALIAESPAPDAAPGSSIVRQTSGSSAPWIPNAGKRSSGSIMRRWSAQQKSVGSF